MSDITQWTESAFTWSPWRLSPNKEVIEAMITLLQKTATPDERAGTIARLYYLWSKDGVLLNAAGSERRIVLGHETFAKPGEVWGIWASAIRKLGGNISHSELLVDFLGAMQRLPVTGRDGPIVQYHIDGDRQWHTLDNIGWTMRESVFEYEHWDETEDSKEAFYQQAPQYLNASTFGAILLIRAEHDFYMQYFAWTAMDEGLESGYDPENLEQEWKVLIPPAATWILIAAEKMHVLCKKGYRNIEPAPEKWSLWRESFLTLSTSSKLDDRCRDLCVRAARRMAEIE